MRIALALIAAPLLALVDQSVAFALAGWACAHQHDLALHAVHLAFLAAIAAATVPAWRLHRSMARQAGSDETVRRRRFLAGLAAGSGALALAAVAAMWAATWMVSPCVG
jgi:hypothetical protein